MTSSTQAVALENTVTEYGKQNIFGKETQPQLVEEYKGYVQEAELANGRWAMIGFVALIGAYLTTGQVLPGIF
tara:strand:- start:101 stop:319 length:219 start_codon:yes stop_codon:yes gene_type:complete